MKLFFYVLSSSSHRDNFRKLIYMCIVGFHMASTKHTCLNERLYFSIEIDHMSLKSICYVMVFIFIVLPIRICFYCNLYVVNGICVFCFNAPNILNETVYLFN